MPRCPGSFPTVLTPGREAAWAPLHRQGHRGAGVFQTCPGVGSRPHPGQPDAQPTAQTPGCLLLLATQGQGLPAVPPCSHLSSGADARTHSRGCGADSGKYSRGTEPGTWERWTRGVIITTIIFTTYPETCPERSSQGNHVRNLGSVPIESGLRWCSPGPSTRAPLGDTWGGLLHGAAQEGRPCQPLVWKEAQA